MDRLNSPAHGPAHQSPHNQATPEGRQSFDSQRIRLRKKRSYDNAGVRNASQPLPATAWPQTTNVREPGDNERARRGTLRNVVRRIFGRRSKEFDPHPPLRASPPRHGYHRSEPPALSLPRTATHHASEQDSTIPHRTLSAPVHHLIPPPPPPNLDRQRSPYAVEFPHSARLKPLNLANPFTAPGSQLRRRKTLPSLVIPDNNEGPPQTPDDAQGSPDRKRSAHLGNGQDTVSPRRRGSGPHGTSPRNSKRKSRSVGDLKLFQRTAAAPEQTSPRKRNEDLRIWRDSLHGYNDDYVLRASGFTSAMISPPPRLEGEREGEGGRSGEVRGDERVQTSPAGEEIFPARVSSGGGETTVGNGDTGFLQHQPTYKIGGLAREEGTKTEEEEEEEEEISHDLEDRVAKLEAGLRHFQLSLQRMTTTTADDRSRSSGPVVFSEGQCRTPPPPSSSHRRRRRRDGGVRGGDGVDYARTPSMLADTLAADFLSSPHLHHQHHPQGFDGSDADSDPPLRRLPSSSPLQYYYRQPSSAAVHDPQRPESPQTPPALQDSGLSHHHYGNLSGARPSMPPLPRADSMTRTTREDEEDEEEEEEENFPFPAQAASFSLSRRRGRTGHLPSSSGMATSGLPVDSPSEPPPNSSGPWTRKESGGFHFPFSSSSFREDRQEEEEQGQEREKEQVKERKLRQEHGQHRDRESEHRPPEFPAPQQRQRQLQQQQQQQLHTFKSLYEMLSDERSARRNLEVQLKGLRREIRDLHLQVSSSSSVDVSADASPPDSRSRMLGDVLMAKGGRADGKALSGRFQDSFASQQQQQRRRHRSGFSSDGPGSGREGDGPQLQEAGDSGINPAYLSQPSSQHAVGNHENGVISRFSGSESEAGGGGGAETTRTAMERYEEQRRGEETDDEDELMTPLEAYQTPREEEASRVGLREGIGAF
ncbi:hypothetical protein KC340_g2867 [Hortaea werneckii]|nr:hypothetical protein KC339_g8895 [Hortaea werneckii]KAI7244371.1 hypothetical protein KC365_g1469 [Hortaea werneckii]KAI7333533.1 hypothetical protein KC340_g2867 [Hortaea werneckii]